MRRECGYNCPRNDCGAYDDDCGAYDDDCGAYDDDCGAYDDDCGAYDDDCGAYDDDCWAAFVAKRCWFQSLRCTGPGVRRSRWMDPSASWRIPLVRNPTHT